MIPTRVSIMTLNLWRDERWEDREPALENCFRTIRPDVLCLQELTPPTRARLDDLLSGYDRVDDEFRGWARESNVYWRVDLFDRVEHGIAEIGHLDEYRRLFWTRLAVEERTLLVSTAHFTAHNHQREMDTGQSPRIEQSRRTASALNELRREGEPVLFTGDLNDTVHPRWILDESGFADCFTELDLPPPPTFPARPTKPDRHVERPIDWIFGNESAHSVAATVPRFYHDDVAPSDHWPVLAVYELE